MTSAEERVELVRRAFEAYAANELADVSAHLDPEIEIYTSPDFMNAGTARGYEGWLEWTEQWNEAWAEFRIEVEEAEAVGERHALATVRQTGRGRTSGVEISQEACYLLDVRDGRAVYLGLYPNRDAALAAAREREGD